MTWFRLLYDELHHDGDRKGSDRYLHTAVYSVYIIRVPSKPSILEITNAFFRWVRQTVEYCMGCSLDFVSLFGWFVDFIGLV